MLLAGIENPSITIEWAMAELLKNPRAMEKAQAEVRQAIKKKKRMEETDIQELKYLKSVIKETLRLHPPLPAMIRESRDRFEIQGYEILGNTKVIINAWAIGRDPKYWVDPNCFRPERFLDSSIGFQDSNYEYIPFGGGRRMCPGVSLGISSVELPLAQLLHHFDWKLPNGIKSEELDMNEIYLVTAKRRNDLLVIPTPCLP